MGLLAWVEEASALLSIGYLSGSLKSNDEEKKENDANGVALVVLLMYHFICSVCLILLKHNSATKLFFLSENE